LILKTSLLRALELLEPVIDRHGVTVIEVALRWCTHHSALKIKDGSDGSIIGFSSVDQFQINLDDFDKDGLPAAVIDALHRASYVVKADATKFWHGELVYTQKSEKIEHHKIIYSSCQHIAIASSYGCGEAS
jgi:aflatoxin B1 aldehyde reductase